MAGQKPPVVGQRRGVRSNNRTPSDFSNTAMLFDSASCCAFMRSWQISLEGPSPGSQKSSGLRSFHILREIGRLFFKRPLDAIVHEGDLPLVDRLYG